jgi:hypothetical protein
MNIQYSISKVCISPGNFITSNTLIYYRKFISKAALQAILPGS